MFQYLIDLFSKINSSKSITRHFDRILAHFAMTIDILLIYCFFDNYRPASWQYKCKYSLFLENHEKGIRPLSVMIHRIDSYLSIYLPYFLRKNFKEKAYSKWQVSDSHYCKNRIVITVKIDYCKNRLSTKRFAGHFKLN